MVLGVEDHGNNPLTVYQTTVAPALLLIEAAALIKTMAQKPGLYIFLQRK
jgi:hypothetical protein